MNYTFNFWDNIFAFISIIVSSVVAFWIYKLSKQLSAREKYQHELKITEEIRKLGSFQSIILANVKKYHTLRTDITNQTYYKQGAELYTIVQEYGVRVILMPKDANIPVGLIPFEWIKYVRESDSEDNKPIIVCNFKGKKYFKNFKSPFKEINFFYKNPNYKKGIDPDFLYLTSIKSSK
ncbi:MAG TPA: hypothetical protein VIJ75_00375 [Hanamia sp.]